MIVKKLLRTWFCLFLYILLVFFCITGAAEGQDEKKDWVEQALKAYDVQDYETSLYYFTLLADAGDPNAQYMTASHYFFSRGTEQDFDKAAVYARMSAEQGIPASQSLLAIMYLDGLGVEQNVAKAVEFSQLAADGGDAQAQFLIGWLYDDWRL